MRRAETSITGRSLHHALIRPNTGVHDQFGRDVGHYAVRGHRPIRRQAPARSEKSFLH
jgi:hypothetical protein